ncbi:ABC transporter ATP-binding protein [Acinetobacter larvae]|uniref:ABC transporter ATP-binding protein n=1 Tax=Acinetobacter larvae TaxID=1789224 RepID=A0A1B2LYU9_9GAMM|nr:ABC transporter ATP-binding protein [Acinetobacter larvae]AOA58101.1 ABC transporter ATP-binding protein [Acinetobacter larvae]
MLKKFIGLLADDAAQFRRYVALCVAYAVLCGLMMGLSLWLLLQLLHGGQINLLLWLVVLILAVALCWYWRAQVEQAGIAVGVKLLQGLRQRLGQHVATLPVGWFNQHNNTQFSHIVNHGVMVIAQLPAHVFTPVLVAMVIAVMMMLALFCINPILGAIALCGLAILVLMFKVSAYLSAQADAAFQQRFAAASQRIVEFAQAQSVLRAFNAEGQSTRLLQQAVDQQHQSGFKLILLSSCAALCNAWVVQSLFAVLFLVTLQGLSLFSAAAIPLADLWLTLAAILVIFRFIEPLLELAGYSEVIRSATEQIQQLEQIFAAQALTEASQPQVLLDHSITIEQLSFRYHDQQPAVLQDIHLYLPAGSMTALIGTSGSGKSTLARLIARFFDPQAGKIMIGGVDVRSMPTAQLAAQISQIFQDNYLFAGSIADNIGIAKAHASDAEIIAMAHQVGLQPLLHRLPEGIHSLVGEGGARLSGGERQRIAIARALMKDAAILLVDEATAALDAENQALISNLLLQLKGQRTILVIAHQLATITDADQIVVLEQGRVVEQGAPEQLLAQQGHYAEFLQQQQRVKGWHIE